MLSGLGRSTSAMLRALGMVVAMRAGGLGIGGLSAIGLRRPQG
jgi:hypothetical protein